MDVDTPRDYLTVSRQEMGKFFPAGRHLIAAFSDAGIGQTLPEKQKRGLLSLAILKSKDWKRAQVPLNQLRCVQKGSREHFPQSHIHNFSIIAPIDHGKSGIGADSVANWSQNESARREALALYYRLLVEGK